MARPADIQQVACQPGTIPGTSAGAVVGFKVRDFGSAPHGSSVFAIEVDPHSPGSIEVRLDDPDGRALATVTIGANAVGRGWARFRASVPSPTGAHALYPTVRPDGAEL